MSFSAFAPTWLRHGASSIQNLGACWKTSLCSDQIKWNQVPAPPVINGGHCSTHKAGRSKQQRQHVGKRIDYLRAVLLLIQILIFNQQSCTTRTGPLNTFLRNSHRLCFLLGLCGFTLSSILDLTGNTGFYHEESHTTHQQHS